MGRKKKAKGTHSVASVGGGYFILSDEYDRGFDEYHGLSGDYSSI